MKEKEAPLIASSDAWSNEGYAFAALLLGMLVATGQGYPIGPEWFGTATVIPLSGLLLGGIVRLFNKRTSLPKWMLWWSFVALLAGFTQQN